MVKQVTVRAESKMFESTGREHRATTLRGIDRLTMSPLSDGWRWVVTGAQDVLTALGAHETSDGTGRLVISLPSGWLVEARVA